MCLLRRKIRSNTRHIGISVLEAFELRHGISMVSLLVAVALAAPVFGQQTPPAMPEQLPVLTLDEAIAIAVESNPGLAIARERIQRAENQLDEARAAGRFRVGVDARYARVTPVPTFTIPGPDGSPTEVETRAPSQTTATATLSQPIDISRRIALGRGLAELQIDIQEFGEAQTLQQLIADVKNAYYTVLRAQGAVDTAQASLTSAEETLRIARAQFEAGVVARFDVTRAEVDVANIRQSLLQAEGNVQIAMGLLNRVLGIEINRPFRVQEQDVSVAPVTIDIDASVQQALAARPEVRQAETGVRLAEENVRFTRTENDPSLALFVAADWTSNTSAFSPNNTTYTYGASITWPLWNGGATRARAAQAGNDVEIARRGLEQASLAVGFEVRTSATNVMESSRRVQTAQANVTLAEESVRLARIRYQEGVTPFVEVTNAEAALTQARTNLVSARYDYLNAVAQLQRATASQPEYARIVTPASTNGETVPEGVNKIDE